MDSPGNKTAANCRLETPTIRIILFLGSFHPHFCLLHWDSKLLYRCTNASKLCQTKPRTMARGRGVSFCFFSNTHSRKQRNKDFLSVNLHCHHQTPLFVAVIAIFFSMRTFTASFCLLLHRALWERRTPFLWTQRTKRNSYLNVWLSLFSSAQPVEFVWKKISFLFARIRALSVCLKNTTSWRVLVMHDKGSTKCIYLAGCVWIKVELLFFQVAQVHSKGQVNCNLFIFFS